MVLVTIVILSLEHKEMVLNVVKTSVTKKEILSKMMVLAFHVMNTLNQTMIRDNVLKTIVQEYSSYYQMEVVKNANLTREHKVMENNVGQISVTQHSS